MSNTTKIQIIDKRAAVPTRAHPADTGYDIKMIDVSHIEGDTVFFKTGIKVQPPEGYYFEIVPRSSISKLPLMLANSVGIIDEHYRGEVLIPIRILHSQMGEDHKNTYFPAGIVKIMDAKPSSLFDAARFIVDKKPVLCQMILRKREDTTFEVADSLSETSRGDGGFGSTDGKTENGKPVATNSTKAPRPNREQKEKREHKTIRRVSE